MKITMITVCYNSASTIKDTLESVLSQTYTDYEYLIIDEAHRLKNDQGKFSTIVRKFNLELVNHKKSNTDTHLYKEIKLPKMNQIFNQKKK